MKSDDRSILISIVTYNSEHIFKVLDQLKSEFKENKNKDLAVKIFDNNSTNEYKKKLKMYKDFATITFYDENKGFGFGHNYNLLDSKEDYFLVFNPDVILKKKELEKLVEVIKSSSSIGLVVPKVLNDDGTTQHLIRNKITVFDFFLRFIPFSFVKSLFNKRLKKYECRDLPTDKNSEIKMGSGCFMLLKSQAYKKIKGFDDQFFMYFEDNDLCLRLREAGYKIIYCPQATIIHFYEKGAHKNKKLFKIFMTSMYKFFTKWGWEWI